MSGYSYEDTDYTRLFDLLGACLVSGRVDAELLSTNLRLTLSNPAFDRSDTHVIEADGSLAAFAILWQGYALGMLVHPARQGQLEPRLLDWAERRHAAGTTERRMVVLSRDDDTFLRDLLEQRGYQIRDEELRMGRDLGGDLPDLSPPAGITIRPLASDAELDDWLALYAEAFGPRPNKLRHWRAMRADPDHRPALDLVAVASDGRLAGFCYCSIAGFEASNLPNAPGRTEPIAVSGHARGQGLGRALVVAGLRALQHEGASAVLLTTEADNAGAHRLYSSLGYRELYRARWYHRGY